MTSISILTATCPAATLTGQIVTLPVGSQIQASLEMIQAEKARVDVAGLQPAVRVMVRCPGAKHSAPYNIDVDTLLFVGLGRA